MMPRQALFDALLASCQPVHLMVQFILIDGAQPQSLAEGGSRRSPGVMARAVASLEPASMTRRSWRRPDRAGDWRNER